MSGKLQILIAGPSDKANNGLTKWLSDSIDVRVSGIAINSIKLLAMAEEMKPDVILIDFDLNRVPLTHTVQLLGEIRPKPSIIVLTQKITAAIQRRCIEAGAEFVFNKTTDMDELTLVLQGYYRNKELQSRPENKFNSN